MAKHITDPDYDYDGDTNVTVLGDSKPLLEPTISEKELARQNALANALNHTYQVKEVPNSQAEYEQRVADIIASAEKLGLYAERQVIPEHFDEVSRVQRLYTERIVVNDENANLLMEDIRAGMEFTGLMRAESWLRARQDELLRAAERKALLAKKRDRAAQRHAEAQAAQPATAGEVGQLRQEIAELKAVLEQVVGPLP